jgi:hypothetical protein
MASLSLFKRLFQSPREAFDYAYSQNPNDSELRRIHRKLELARKYREKSESDPTAANGTTTYAEVLNQSSLEVMKEAEEMIKDWHSNRGRRK